MSKEKAKIRIREREKLKQRFLSSFSQDQSRGWGEIRKLEEKLGIIGKIPKQRRKAKLEPDYEIEGQIRSGAVILTSIRKRFRDSLTPLQRKLLQTMED